MTIKIELKRSLRAGALAALAAMAVSCAPPPPPPPPSPPPPAPEPFRARPIAPGLAQDTLAVPRYDALGIRQTVNTSLTSAQAVWNLRSAYNVAALNCIGPAHAQLAERYGDFIKTHARELSSTNRALEKQFREIHGPGYQDIRDAYMTQVYNYFSLPPVLPKFCDKAVEVSQELALVPAGGLEAAGPGALAELELVFLDFFKAYELYQLAAAAWHTEYEATYGEPYPYARNPLAATGGVLPSAAGTATLGSPVDPAGPEPATTSMDVVANPALVSPSVETGAAAGSSTPSVNEPLIPAPLIVLPEPAGATGESAAASDANAD